MSLCAPQLFCSSSLRRERRASHAGAAPRRAAVRTRCAATAPQLPPSPVGRRVALNAAAAAALLAAVPLRASAEDDAAEWSRYTRAFRERFETSISSGTRSYTFEYPASWTPEVVSLNDGKLYGTDLRLRNKTEGVQLAVSLLPYVGRDTLADAGTPEQAFQTFAELIGAFWEVNGFGDTTKLTGDIISAEAVTKGGQLYYVYECGNHSLVSANATDGQLYLLTVSAATDRQWRRSEATLRRILASFSVPA